MEEVLKLWEEFEEWFAIEQEKGIPVPGYTPSFAQFMAWYRDVYPLKSPIQD